MADQLTRKLGYLHVTNEGLSDVQLLSIQLHVCICAHVYLISANHKKCSVTTKGHLYLSLQTRLSDWKEGGINSKFMLSKLRSFAVSLQEYEQSAAPEGWKVVWDRCRQPLYCICIAVCSMAINCTVVYFTSFYLLYIYDHAQLLVSLPVPQSIHWGDHLGISHSTSRYTTTTMHQPHFSQVL